MADEKFSNFLTEIIDADLAEGKVKEIHTRFPPEPNGYLHIGSAKAIYINYMTAKTGDPHYYKLPTPHVEGKYNVSFSGLKTAVVNEVHNAQQRGEEVRVADMAASFQERIAQILAKKLLAAAADTNAKTICLAGGVAANGRLRQLVNDGAQKLGAKVYLPELKYCGDNGAMIAAQGYYEFKDGNIADLTLNGLPTLAIDYR